MGDSSGQGGSKIFFGKELEPPRGKHWKYSQERIDQMIAENKLILVCKECGYIHNETCGTWNGCPQCGKDNPIPKYWVPEKEEEVLDSNWSDIYGYSTTWDFRTENSEALLKRIIESSSREGDLIVDFFLGSGTTIAVAHKLDRKWIGIELGDHFHTVVLPRMKKVVAYDKSGISKEINETYNEQKAGGFFKYYRLEQYEEVLQKAIYKASHPLQYEELDPITALQFFLFLDDKKLLHTVQIHDEHLEITLEQLYPKLDLAETLANLKGKMIKQIKQNLVVFEDGEHVSFENLKFSEVKNLIWW